MLWNYFLIIVIFLLFLYIISKKTKDDIQLHWNTYIPDFRYPNLYFYEHLTKELKAQNIKKVDISHIILKERGVASAGRRYLRVAWRDYRFDICFAPFGSGIFVSSWLINKTAMAKMIIARFPLIGRWLYRVFFPETYYTIDTASMYMTCCHSAVLKDIFKR